MYIQVDDSYIKLEEYEKLAIERTLIVSIHPTPGTAAESVSSQPWAVPS